MPIVSPPIALTPLAIVLVAFLVLAGMFAPALCVESSCAECVALCCSASHVPAGERVQRARSALRPLTVRIANAVAPSGRSATVPALAHELIGIPLSSSTALRV
ncbi:MAG: hypothetical protein HGB10_08435 [Coriobacteriia bacterium]|nr:hypothetical protein [Coriobacteriia bacterium]